MKRSLYFVLAWDGDGYSGDALYTTRTLEVRHADDTPTNAEVREAFSADTDAGHYPAGRYRIYPADSVVDVKVRAEVVDPRADEDADYEGLSF